MFDPQSDALTLAVIGAGVMGQGIVQIAAQAGISVRLFDSFDGVAQRAHTALAASFSKLVERGRLTPAQAQAAMARVSVASSMLELADADVVVEAIIEKLEAKQALFQQLEAIVGANTVLATNTSSLSVTAIAAGCAQPQRVVGFHFFNPVPLMKIVEVIEGALTDAQVLDAMLALGQRLGHRAVRAKDTPGFIVNHAGGVLALRPCVCWGSQSHRLRLLTRCCVGKPGSAWGRSSCLIWSGSMCPCR
jgi:3-hydroxybutyryl-CoA dehydrogenase